MNLLHSELILNDDGSVYHLHLKPNDIAETIIFVGDQERVEKVSKHFDSIELIKQKREFKTVTGIYKGTRLSVISTGIGTDNIDIVLNELDALVNIDLQTRTIKPKLTSLNIVRIGTSGALQSDIPVDSFLMSMYAIDMSGMIQSYKTETIANPLIEQAFIKHTKWSPKKSHPSFISGDQELFLKFENSFIKKGITATAGGFYAPQGRSLRLPAQDKNLNNYIESFTFENQKITNLEMETAAIYGLSKLLGHKACSLNAILANRVTGDFSKNPTVTVEKLIEYTLQKIVK